jgi:hypothetical protein
MRNFTLSAIRKKIDFNAIIITIIILTANGFLPSGIGTTITNNTQITHITQNNTPSSNKTTQTIMDTLHTMHTMKIQLQLQQI